MTRTALVLVLMSCVHAATAVLGGHVSSRRHLLQSACDASPSLQATGAAIAAYACARDASDEALADVDEAATSAVAELATDACASQRADVGASARIVGDGFAGAQDCDCVAGIDVVSLSARDAVGDGGGSFAELARSVRVYSESYCAPGTKNGVLDQSAEECSVMSSGNATEQTARLGARFGRSWCVARSRGGRSTTPLVLLASQSLGNATANAVSETEFACSFTQSVLCSLSDEQVGVVSSAQADGFARALTGTVADECGCVLNADDLTAALSPALRDAAVETHAAVCESSQAEFVGMANPIRDRIQPAVMSALGAGVFECAPGRPDGPRAPGALASPPSTRESRTSAGPPIVYPFATCGSNDYARGLADPGAKHVAPAIATACCTPGYECVVKSRWHASCRPVGERPSAGWNGTVVTLEGCERTDVERNLAK